MNCFYDESKPLVFDNDGSKVFLESVVNELLKRGYNPRDLEDFKKGTLDLFKVEHINAPKDPRGIMFLATHVSDLDAVLFSFYYEAMNILSKQEWTENDVLMNFLKQYFNFIGISREKDGSDIAELKKLLGPLKNGENCLIFTPGTITDVKMNSKERMLGAAYLGLSERYDTRLVISEYPSMESTRYYYSDRIVVPTRQSKEYYQEYILEAYLKLLEEMSPACREPVLTYKHSNNNKSGDQFF